MFYDSLVFLVDEHQELFIDISNELIVFVFTHLENILFRKIDPFFLDKLVFVRVSVFDNFNKLKSTIAADGYFVLVLSFVKFVKVLARIDLHHYGQVMSCEQ